MPGRLPVMPVRIIAYTIAYHVGLPPTILHGRLRNERHNGTTVSGPAAGGVTENSMYRS